MQYTKEWLSWAEQVGVVAGQLATGFGVGVANNFVNNLPLGLIVGSTVHIAHSTPRLPTLCSSAWT